MSGGRGRVHGHFRTGVKSRGRHAPGAAGAHVAYILRRSACDYAETNIGAAIECGEDYAKMSRACRAFFDHEEAAERANGQVGRTYSVSFPHELSREGCERALGRIARWCYRVGSGPGDEAAGVWALHLHDGQRHGHGITRTVGSVSGRKLHRLSERQHAERYRAACCRIINGELKREGVPGVTWEHRSFKRLSVLGILDINDAEPTIHEGPPIKGRGARSDEARRERASRVAHNAEIRRRRAAIAAEASAPPTWTAEMVRERGGQAARKRDGSRWFVCPSTRPDGSKHWVSASTTPDLLRLHTNMEAETKARRKAERKTLRDAARLEDVRKAVAAGRAAACTRRADGARFFLLEDGADGRRFVAVDTDALRTLHAGQTARQQIGRGLEHALGLVWRAVTYLVFGPQAEGLREWSFGRTLSRAIREAMEAGRSRGRGR